MGWCRFKYKTFEWELSCVSEKNILKFIWTSLNSFINCNSLKGLKLIIMLRLQSSLFISLNIIFLVIDNNSTLFTLLLLTMRYPNFFNSFQPVFISLQSNNLRFLVLAFKHLFIPVKKCYHYNFIGFFCLINSSPFLDSLFYFLFNACFWLVCIIWNGRL